MRNFYCVKLHSLETDSFRLVVCPSYADAWDDLRRLKRELAEVDDYDSDVVELSSDDIRSLLDNDDESIEFRYPLSADSLED